MNNDVVIWSLHFNILLSEVFKNKIKQTFYGFSRKLEIYYNLFDKLK